jgi:hypothetical protein
MSAEQDHELWKLYARGRRQFDIARKYGVSQQAVSAAIARHRATIPQESKDEIIRKEVDLLTSLRDEVLALWHDTTGAPVTAGKDGAIVRDPETREVVRDHTGRLTAVRTALQVSERLARVTGIDAAVRIDLSASEDAETKAAAAEALSRLHGGTGQP